MGVDHSTVTGFGLGIRRDHDEPEHELLDQEQLAELKRMIEKCALDKTVDFQEEGYNGGWQQN